MPSPQQLRHVLVTGLWLVGFAVLHSTAVLAAPVACKPGEVARGERISEVCSCRGWTITAECRSQCCSRLNMVAGIHAMCGDVCDRTSSSVASSDLVRGTDDGGTLLLAERVPRRYPQVRFGVSAFTLPDASELVSDRFPDRVFLSLGERGFDLDEPSVGASGLGVGMTVDLAPRWNVEVGFWRSTDLTVDAALSADGLAGRLRSTVDLSAARILARFGHNDPAVPCPWTFGLGVQRWRVEQSRPSMELEGRVFDGPLVGIDGDRVFELEERSGDLDEVIASVGWNKRWHRLAVHLEATYGSESSVAASFGVTAAIHP